MATILGTEGADSLFSATGDEADTFELFRGDDVAGGSGGNDTMDGGRGNDTLFGQADDDRLFGSIGNDTLYGGSGNDLLHGGVDIDRMTGGSGADDFVFFFIFRGDSGVGAGNRDVITDFERGLDDIDLSFIDARVGTSGNQSFSFISTQSFSAEGQVRYFFEGAKTIIQLNTTGTSGAEMEIELTGIRQLGSSDFVL